MGDGSSKRPSLVRKRSTTRRRGQKWSPERHGWPSDASGVVVMCRQRRLMDAIFDPAGTGDVWMSGPGLAATGNRRPRHHGPIRVGCPDHEHHRVDVERLAAQIELARAKPGRRRVPVGAVSAEPVA